jgi:hypothetical protein
MRAILPGHSPNRPRPGRARLAGLLCGLLACWLVCEPVRPIALLLGVARANSEAQKESKPFSDEDGESGKLTVAGGSARRSARKKRRARSGSPYRVAAAWQHRPVRPPVPDHLSRFAGAGTGAHGLGAPLRC